MERFFQEEMRELNNDLLKMAALVEESIRKSVDALKTMNHALAEQVISDDAAIDAMELRIEQKAINLLALHQPMARDLRFIISTGIKMNSELERIADMSVNIAQRVLELGTAPLLKPLVDIPRLTELALEMVRKAIDAYVHQDEQKAKEVILSDAQVDQLKNAIQDELINEFITKDASTAPRAVPLLLVSRHLERIGDHATNIAEDIIYMVKAQVVKHHRERVIGKDTVPEDDEKSGTGIPDKSV
ncbi:MAG: phosphate signaling complex protein PhoU [Candidatus Omnitrophica bacterium]|nr:phosphate signaling complex protein PhoU [Candidatus Omnitrophota bacterium]